jgi:hypothetical protein
MLNIDLELVSVKPSNNLTSPNGMGSAASITSEACAYVSIQMSNTLVFIYVLLNLGVKCCAFCNAKKTLKLEDGVFDSLPSQIKDLSRNGNQFKRALQNFLYFHSFYALDEYFSCNRI